MAETTEKAWYEQAWDWLGTTASNLYNTKVQGDVAKAQAEALAKEQAKQENLSFLGMNLSKQTLLWIAGGSVLLVFLLTFSRR